MAITLRAIARQFGSVPVLRGIDLDIQDGELIALLGASGSGKTTLLRILAGLDWPDAGEIAVDGRDLLALEAQRRQVGFVFQHYALFEHMTVFENVAFGLRVRPRGRRPGAPEIRTRVGELLDLVQIGDLAQRFPAQLSGGQRQRVALARALAIRPRVLLLDEPFGALDAQIRKELRRWLRTLHETLRTTTLFVTHDHEEAFELADRIVLLDRGRIAQAGTPDEIYDRPASPFVARFMGRINELPAQLRNGRLVVADADTSAVERIAAGDGIVTLFVRPSEIALQASPHARSRVLAIASNGPSVRYDVTVPDIGQTVEVELPREAARALTLGRGDPVQLHILRGRVFAPADPLAPTATQSPRAAGLSA